MEFGSSLTKTFNSHIRNFFQHLDTKSTETLHFIVFLLYWICERQNNLLFWALYPKKNIHMHQIWKHIYKGILTRFSIIQIFDLCNILRISFKEVVLHCGKNQITELSINIPITFHEEANIFFLLFVSDDFTQAIFQKYLFT